LTLEAALERARQRSVVVRAARGRAAEAQARLKARPALRDNPEIEGAWGSRENASSSDFEVGLGQTFELGGRNGARRAIDEAAFGRETAEADETERAVLRDVRTAFFRGLHAAERLRLARATAADAAELNRIAERRHASGDVAALEVNVAASGLARSRAAVKAAEALEASALADVRTLLDMEATAPLSLAGSLTEERTYDFGALLAASDGRPEIRALAHQLREAEAEVRLGKGSAWPDLTPSVRYERDQGDRVLWAGLRVTLPLFDNGQQLRAAGSLRVERLRLEIEARKRVLANQAQGLVAQHELRAAAVRELVSNAERLTDNEALARRSYEVGQIGLAELVVVRRETLDARRELLDSLLELAQARAELDSLAGGSR
jgi:cobalt-zinc-cadmium efflux system outer membrane protein